MAFILGFLAFLAYQNIVSANTLNLTETSSDQNATNICTDMEIFNGSNCTLLTEENVTSVIETQTSSGDILTDTTDTSTQILNFTEVSLPDGYTSGEESIFLTINSSGESTNDVDENVTDLVISETTSFEIPESYNRSLQDTTDLNFTVQEEPPHVSHTKPSTSKNNVLVLKSNCSLENSEEFASEHVTNVGCTVYLDLNYVSQNGSEASIAKLIQELKPLSIRSGEFDIVESHEDGKIPVNEDKIPSHFFDRETFAYLAVACSFALVLLIACIIFGLRCLKKKKPAFDMSRFDIKLSDYTLTRIPRASLISSTEYLHHPKLVDRPKYSTVPRENCSSLKCSNEENSKGDDLIEDRFPSTREFKTFKSGRIVELPENHIDTNINFNSSAYENPTFQRYF